MARTRGDASTDVKGDRPPTAQAWVLEELRRRVSTRDLRPGEQILADSIASSLGVSRVPVREALRILEGEGQVEHRPHRGYFVAELQQNELEEIYRIRHLLEADALRTSIPLLGKDAFERLDEALSELHSASESRDIRRHVQLNRRFHWIFLEKLRAPRFERLIEAQYDACDPYGALYYNTAENRTLSEEDHVRMVEAAREGDVEGFIEILEGHRRRVIETLRVVLSEDNHRPA